MHNKFFVCDFNQRSEIIYYLAYVLKMLYPVSDLPPICRYFSVWFNISSLLSPESVSAASVIYLF